MVEEKYYANLYNPEVKKGFLEQYDNEDTQATYSFIFSRIKEEEVNQEKDIYEFNLPQIEKALYLVRPISNPAARSAGRIITSYINWAIKEGLRTNNINPLKMVDSDWFKKFVDNTKKLYFSEKELMDIEKDLVNAQDAIVPRLLFEGVSGYGGSEILNLKKDDCDFTNNLLILNDDKKGKRENFEVSRECMSLIRTAINDKEYRKMNGESTSRNPVVPLVENDYVVRNAGTRVENFEKADKHTIYRRLAHISKMLGIPNFSSKNIERSGMLKMAKDIYIRDENNGEELTNEQLKEIAIHFNLSLIKQGEYELYNFSAIREYINLDNIKKLYDI